MARERSERTTKSELVEILANSGAEVVDNRGEEVSTNDLRVLPVEGNLHYPVYRVTRKGVVSETYVSPEDRSGYIHVVVGIPVENSFEGRATLLLKTRPGVVTIHPRGVKGGVK